MKDTLQVILDNNLAGKYGPKVEALIKAFTDGKVEIWKEGTHGQLAANVGRIYIPTNEPKVTFGNEAGKSVENFIEMVGHEVSHALQMGYILNNKGSNEVKYLQKVVDRLELDNMLSGNIRITP